MRDGSTAQERIVGLSRRQRHQLHRIEAGLLRSDPQLAAMLRMFGGLSAGDVMPAWEQMPGGRRSIGQTVARIAKAISDAATPAPNRPRPYWLGHDTDRRR